MANTRRLKVELNQIGCLVLMIGTLSVFLHAAQVDESIYADDPLPDICSIVTAEDIGEINPFSNNLSKVIADPNNFETYNGCHYEFFTPDDKPMIAIRLIKWGSNQEALEDYRMQERRASEWPAPPEPISGVADQAFFSYDSEDAGRCNECSLVAIRDQYGIYVALKGQYEKVPRSKKKETALKILKLMRERISELR